MRKTDWTVRATTRIYLEESNTWVFAAAWEIEDKGTIEG